MAPLDGRSAAAQVEALDPFVRAEGGGGALVPVRAELQDVAVVGDLQDRVTVLLYEWGGRFPAVDDSDEPEELLD